MKNRRRTWWAHMPQEYEVQMPTPMTDEPNLISSLTGPNNGPNNRWPRVLDVGLHAPALDLDFPATLRKSKTPGHYHLYLHKELTWKKYVKLLRCLAAVGIIEKGYLKASEARGATFLRINEFSLMEVRAGEEEEASERTVDDRLPDPSGW